MRLSIRRLAKSLLLSSRYAPITPPPPLSPPAVPTSNSRLLTGPCCHCRWSLTASTYQRSWVREGWRPSVSTLAEPGTTATLMPPSLTHSLLPPSDLVTARYHSALSPRPVRTETPPLSLNWLIRLTSR